MNISKLFSILESAPVGWSFGNSNCPTLRQIENRPSNSGNSGGSDDSSTSDTRDTGLTDQYLKKSLKVENGITIVSLSPG